MLAKIVESCQFLLDNYPEARLCKSYLDSRLEEKSQKDWGFGYFPNIKNISALTDLVSADVLLQLELLTSREIEDSFAPRRVLRDFFEDHPLIMPFRDSYGQIVSLVGRSILDETERKIKKIIKYKNTAESSIFKKGHLLFGLYENKQSILENGCVYIVEGQFDVIKAAEKGLRNIVALGNNNMTSYQFSLISRYSNNIFLLLDNDDPGQKGRKRIINKFGQFANIRNFYLPDNYKDIDEYLTKENIRDYTEIPFIVKD